MQRLASILRRANLSGGFLDRITSGFGARTTTADVLAGIDLGGRSVIVTGASSGLGMETARALAAAHAEVTLAVRNVDAGREAAASIAAATNNRRLYVAALDLADRESIAAFVASWRGPLHILVNNAGVMAIPLGRTAEGWEMQFATNHLGHFALARGLRDAMRRAGGARIVSVSSSAHHRSPVVFEDIHFERRPYDPLAAYGQSKTANVLFAVAATSRWRNDGITVNAVMPGAIATGLQRHLGGMKTPVEKRKTIEQGAATSVWLATSAILEGVSGRYFEDCSEALPYAEGGDPLRGVASYALDPGSADRLWDESTRLLA